jgi:putative membrane protein
VSAETVADRRVHPATIPLRFAKEMPSTVLALPAALAFMSDVGLALALALAALIALLLLFLNWLAWRRFRYGVGADEIVIESGILHRTRRVIPFDRIQDVDLERRPLQRLFGLAKVRIETGAGGKDEGVLDSVLLAEADRLREAVRSWRQAGALSPAADAGPAAGPAGRVLFEMDLGRVLLFGLFNFSLVFLAGLFALLQTFDNFLPFDIYDPARWVGLVGEQLPRRFTPAALSAVLLLALLLGVVAGVLRTLSRDYGFRLTADGERFRREHGLFTRSEVVIAKPRVQLARLSTGPIRRRFGWFGLAFQTLGAGADGSGLQSAAPFARRAELLPIVEEAGGLRLPPPPELTMVSRRHLLRALGPRFLFPLLIIANAGFWWRPAWLLLAALPLLAILVALERRFHRYALDEGLLFIERGVWRQTLWALPVANAQAVGVSRSWLQRRLGLATVTVDTAGAPLAGPARIVDVRLETARWLATEISARRRLYSGRKSGTDR